MRALCQIACRAGREKKEGVWYDLKIDFYMITEGKAKKMQHNLEMNEGALSYINLESALAKFH